MPDARPAIERRAYPIVLAVALAVAAFLLFFRLGAHDPLTDEEEIAFRALGYVDFLNAQYQTTPYEWFEPAPWWTTLSFHDHPPLVFLVEHFVFRLFGDSLLALRLPFALLGLGSLVLLGAIARRLYDDGAACVVLALATVNTYWLWVFRLGLQEGPVIFFLLAGIYCLTRARTDARWLIAWGVAAGLGMLTKYTSIIAFPLAIAYALLCAPSLLRQRQFAIGMLVAAALFSPVLIYNLEMYRAVGHFDLQFATVLAQSTPQWSVLPGKAIGSIGDRLRTFLPTLWWSATWLFVPLVALSVVTICLRLIRHRRRDAWTSTDAFVIAGLAITTLLILLVGTSTRFLVLLIPLALLACGSEFGPLLAPATERGVRRATVAVLAVLIVGQALVSFRTLHATEAGEIPNWTVSSLRYDSAALGHAELEDYLHALLDGSTPAVSLGLPPRLHFVESLRQRHWRGPGGQARSFLIVYDPRLNNVAKFWLYDRRYFYDGWPILSIDEYQEAKRSHPRLFAEMGITDTYYVAVEDGLFTAGNTSPSANAAEVNSRLAAMTPERVVTSPAGRKTFTIYRNPDL